MGKSEGALAGVRVVDLTDERGIYGAKLLADLGADVVRPEPLDGDPLRERGPHLKEGNEGHTSLWHAFFASNRRFFALDPATQEGRQLLARLIGRAEIVLTSPGSFAVDEADLPTVLEQRPELVVVDTSSFGADGPWADYLAPDLVAGALGGSVATTGDVDTPPLKCFGELNFMVSGAYTAIAALSALYCQREQGIGQRVDVSVHECLVSCLEHILMWYWYAHTRPGRTEKALARRGSLHWSNAYEIMQAKGGSIMITPTPKVGAQIAWLEEVGAEGDIRDPSYREPENVAQFMPRLMELLADWAATRDVEELFLEAQERHAPFGWVLPIERVADNPQLAARQWWASYRVGDESFQGPGMPYHFSRTPWSMGAYHGPGEDTDAVLADINWGAKR